MITSIVNKRHVFFIYFDDLAVALILKDFLSLSCTQESSIMAVVYSENLNAALTLNSTNKI